MRSAFFIFLVVVFSVIYFWAFESDSPFVYQNENVDTIENYLKENLEHKDELATINDNQGEKKSLGNKTKAKKNDVSENIKTPQKSVENNRETNQHIANYANPSTLVQPIEQKSEKHKSIKKTKKQAGHILTPLFEKTSVESQFFELYSNKAAVLKAKKGAVLAIPEACFVDENNKVATGYIEIEVKELFGKSEMLLSNFSTVSQYDILTSEGGIYLNAKNIHGETLTIAPYKSIYVEMPSKKRVADAWIYYGENDEQGQINWKAANRPNSRLISFPLHSLHFDKADLSDELYKKLHSENYENTLIATREFEERLLFIQKNKHIHGNRIEPILDYFFKNLHKNLFEIDYLLQSYFTSLLKVYPYQDGDYVEEIKALSEQFRRFYEEKLTTVLHSRPYNIDLTDENAFQKLRQKGMGSQKANYFINLYQYGAAIIKDRQEKNKVLVQKKNGGDLFSKNTFVINKTGWINIDANRHKNYQKRKLEVQLENEKEISTAVYLLFKDRMTLIPALKKEDIETQQISYMFKNLPNKEDVYLIALGYKNGQPFIDVQDIEVGKQEVSVLKMRPTTIDMLSYQITQLN
ncbi:MAG: hypothetical protein ACPG5B_07845 [Chitinophagales bacterium]